MNLSKACKITRVSNAVAAGTSDINSSSVDMGADGGYDSVMFLVEFGTITSGAVTSVKAEQSADDSSWNDLAGTGVTVADTDDNGVAWLDVHRPGDRYVRCTVDRATQNAVVDGITAIQYNARELPTTHDATTVLGGEFHLTPAEGTA